MEFFKYQAAGNDYLVYAAEAPFDFTPEQISLICSRHCGLGSDGILVPGKDPDKSQSVRIYNVDGSEAEKSGNGLRIFARYLWDQRLVCGTPFEVVTKGGLVTCQVLDEGQRISVQMGRARFRDLPDATIAVGDMSLQLHVVSMGNPHCVVFLPKPTEALAKELGPMIENLALFPNRTNVQFVRVMDRHRLEVHIWERGVGYTLSSGTSSCAAAAVSHRLGLVDADVAVHMPGGVINIQLGNDYDIQMQGPVCKVGRYELDTECLSALGKIFA